MDSDGDLWIGTDGGGMDMFDKKNEKFIHYQNQQNDSNSLVFNRVFKIIEGEPGILWIATFGGGLSKFNKKTKTFTNYKNNPNEKNTLGNDYIIAIEKDSYGNIWLGMYSMGLIKFDPKTEMFTHYSSKQGIPDNTIYAILFDSKSGLWFSHNKGLAVLDTQSVTFTNFTIKDGLQGNEFNGNASFRTDKGEMFFGGINGFNSFFPDSIKSQTYKPPIVIVDFSLYNKPVKVNEEINDKILLEKSILYTKVIELDYSDKIFAFEFAALDYSSLQNNRFRYKMKGLTDEWIDLGTKNYVSFNSIPPGEYVLSVKCSNIDGVWNNQAVSIRIKIKPPWWQTFWFYIILFIIIASLVYAYILWREQKLKNDKKKLEEIIQERTFDIMEQKREITAQNEELIQQQEEITAQRDAIEEKNIELEKLSIVASKVDNSVIIADKNGKIEWANDGFSRLLGISVSDYINKYGENIFKTSTNENIETIVENLQNKKKSVVYNSKTYTYNGREIWIRTTLTPILNDNNQIEKIIAIDSDITDLKNAENEIISKNNELEQKNMLIEGSIKYAKTIQRAILPLIDVIREDFDTFIIYRPKDIVSGDFYWHSKTANYSFIAVVDCTGHGVPGAFMSMIGRQLLKEIVNERNILNPSEILQILNKEVVKALKQNVTDNKDGMDVCLCRIEKTEKENKLVYSGAKRSLYIYRTQIKELEKVKGTRKTIGGHLTYREHEEFLNTELVLEKDDVLYLTTDGYVDQNCKDRSRFGTGRFLYLLQKIGNYQMNEQKQLLNTELNKFMQGEKQRDDITVMGLKVK